MAGFFVCQTILGRFRQRDRGALRRLPVRVRPGEGKKDERKKSAQKFFFLQVLLEDGKTNRMHESLRLFKTVVNNIHFTAVVSVMLQRARVLLIPPFLQAFIVFFNKRDLFVAKLARVSAGEEGAVGLDAAFADCPPAAAAGDLEEAEDFVIEKYVSQSRS